MPFDPEPYIHIGAAHCWNGGPFVGAAGIYCPPPAQTTLGRQKATLKAARDAVFGVR
jgi:hypothetical protein